MSTLLKEGRCTCGCVEQQVRETSAGIMFTMIGGIGYVVYDEEAPYALRVYDEYFEEHGEKFNGEMPVDYAIKKTWQHFHMVDDEMPEKTFKETIINIHKMFNSAVQ